MEYPKKVWVIDVPLPFPFGNAQIRREGPALPPPNFGGGGGPNDGAKGKRRGKGKGEDKTPAAPDPAAQRHSRWHVVFAYALGPLYPLLTRWHVANLLWGLFGLAAIGALAGMVVYHAAVRREIEMTRVALLPLCGAAAGIVFLAITSWARAIWIAGWRTRERGPFPLRHPAIVTVLGLMAPGSGLVLGGHPRRGALAVWMLGPLVFGALILSQAPWLWHLNQSFAGASRVPRSALELGFLVSAVGAIGAAFLWLVQAMDGARLASRTSGRVPHGQRVSLALLTAIVAFIGLWQPIAVGSMLDQFAVALRLEGLRVLPLVMELGAAKLDPAEPIYLSRAADLYERLGQRDRAQELRSELDQRWSVYERTVRAEHPRQAGPTRSPAGPDPMQGPMPPPIQAGPMPPLPIID
jgi:hypothetical protein